MYCKEQRQRGAIVPGRNAEIVASGAFGARPAPDNGLAATLSRAGAECGKTAISCEVSFGRF